jgi:hypothetical protein
MCTRLLVKIAPSVSSAMDKVTCRITKPLRKFHLRMDNEGSACLIAKLRSAFQPLSAGSRQENRSVANVANEAYSNSSPSFWKWNSKDSP